MRRPDYTARGQKSLKVQAISLHCARNGKRRDVWRTGIYNEIVITYVYNYIRVNVIFF